MAAILNIRDDSQEVFGEMDLLVSEFSGVISFSNVNVKCKFI